ncbi:DUF262 domain-containing protein [Mucilaginibacter sp. HC2]|uniref:GmrSD restriction endonuclease domain-containing protein n=1 Tax=Mucilaginibacter inviolabilis TaxID=2714892 RepID=UPI00140A53EC|nr:DUF262 domain-containing protein [Mucilaginibacter inviolabilis]NHA05466.1 DUF262 domain-containing protein [Mucilaginibacter inviolabilis]
MNFNQSMEEVSVGTLLDRYNLIVPEIQREYVWGNNYNNILVTFFNDIKEGLQETNNGNAPSKRTTDFLLNALSKADSNIQKTINEMLVKINQIDNELNIGFLYSYRPDYYVFNDRNEDINLIDGQQRFTTLFFMLFYFSVKEKRKADFMGLFRFDLSLERIAFDYRVRSLTHSFFIDLINHTKSLDDLIKVDGKNWFLANYNGDPTVKAIVHGLFPKLHESFKDDDKKYYNFVRDNVKFWHFRTEETSQGEELYITMNSRGQQLADNENLRAKLFELEAIRGTGKTTLDWSEQWEIWQDFFWKKRNKKDALANADAGFNEFLRWIQIIKMTEKQRIILDDEDDESPDKKEILKYIRWDQECQLQAEHLPLVEINKYFLALNYLFEEFPNALKQFSKQYSSYNHFDLLDPKWLAPNGIINQLELFRLLPILYHVKKVFENGGQPQPLNIFRLIRFFYNLRFNETIVKTSSFQTIQAIKIAGRLKAEDDSTSLLSRKAESIVNSEERLKLTLIRESNERFQLEEQLWMAEDMDYHRGSIRFLIDWTITQSSGVFQFKIFKKLLASYKELILAENEIRGDLLPIKAFLNVPQRVTWNSAFFKEPEYLNFVLKWSKAKNISLSDYLIGLRKNFINNYNTVENVQNEASFKKQVYIYYILGQNILKKNDNWNWAAGKNFGIWERYPDCKSIFNNKNIFQQYKSQWKENARNIIWIQRSLNIGPRKIQVLLDWGKS